MNMLMKKTRVKTSANRQNARLKLRADLLSNAGVQIQAKRVEKGEVLSEAQLLYKDTAQGQC